MPATLDKPIPPSSPLGICVISVISGERSGLGAERVPYDVHWGYHRLLRKLPGDLWVRLKDQFMVEVTAVNNDPLFDYLTLWLNDHPYSKIG